MNVWVSLLMCGFSLCWGSIVFMRYFVGIDALWGIRLRRQGGKAVDGGVWDCGYVEAVRRLLRDARAVRERERAGRG